MRPLFVSSLILFVLLAACRRNVAIQTDYARDPDGKEYKVCEYEYVLGKDSSQNEMKLPHGFMRIYYPDGKIMKEEHYDRGVLEGESKAYGDRGILFDVENWSVGALDGKTTTYNAAGRIVVETSYKKGKRDGEERLYHENGKIKTILINKDDRLWQSVANYDSSGKKLDELGVVEGNGVLKVWNSSNTLSASTEMRNGLPHGKVRRYFENGKLQMEYDIREGRKQGLLKAFHHNGVLARESTYADDYLTGVNRLYDSTGVLREELSYKPHLTPLDIRRLNQGIMKALNEALDVSQFDRGVLSGAHKIYHENGKLQFEEYLFDNLPDSMEREYYDNGQLKSEIFYDRDFEHSRRYKKTFTRNGKLVKSITEAKRKRDALESEPDTVSSFLNDALSPDKQ